MKLYFYYLLQPDNGDPAMAMRICKVVEIKNKKNYQLAKPEEIPVYWSKIVPKAYIGQFLHGCRKYIVILEEPDTAAAKKLIRAAVDAEIEEQEVKLGKLRRAADMISQFGQANPNR